MSIVPWTPRFSAGVASQGLSTAWSPTLNRFVSVGSNDFAEYSSDGITWTISQASPVSPSPPLIWNGVSYLVWASTLGLFVGCGQQIDGLSGGIWTSPDGITWTERVVPNALTINQSLFGIAWSEDLGVLAIPSYLTSNVLTSTDGINWTEQIVTGSELTLTVADIVWSKARGTFLGLTNISSTLTSTDGISWVTTLIAPYETGLSYIAYSEALDLYVNATSTVIRSSSDGGTTWVERVPTVDGHTYFTRVTYISRPGIADIGLFMVAGYDAFQVGDWSGAESIDGITWVGNTSVPIFPPGEVFVPEAIAWSPSLNRAVNVGGEGNWTLNNVRTSDNLPVTLVGSAVNPDTGEPVGGETVTITGSFTYEASSRYVLFDMGRMLAQYPTITAGSIVSLGADTGTNHATSVMVTGGTTLTCVSPTGIGVVDIVVVARNPATNLYVVEFYSHNGYTFFSPTLTVLTPATGPSAGGLSVALTGTHLIGEVADAALFTSNQVDVMFGGVSASSVVITSTIAGSCITPPAANGTVTATYVPPYVAAVVTNGLSGTPSVGSIHFAQSGAAWFVYPSTSLSFTDIPTWIDEVTGELRYQATAPGLNWTEFLEESPSIFFVTPNVGLTTGGDPDDPNDANPRPLPVTIVGDFFVRGATVTFGGTSATSIVIQDRYTISCVIPAHAAGSVSVVVTNPSALTGTLTNGFTYILPSPVIVGITPRTGTTVGGVAVTIQGRHFVTGALVSFSGLYATSNVVVHSQEITCVTPRHTKGLKDVRVDQ